MMSPWDTVPYRHYQHFNTSERQVVEGCERSTKEVSSKSTLFSNTDPEEPGRRKVHGQVPQHQLPPGERLVLLLRRRWRQKGRIQSQQALKNVIWIKSHKSHSFHRIHSENCSWEEANPRCDVPSSQKNNKVLFRAKKGPNVENLSIDVSSDQ